MQSVENNEHLFPCSVVTCRESLSCAWLASVLFQISFVICLAPFCVYFEYICTLFLLVNKTDL